MHGLILQSPHPFLINRMCLYISRAPFLQSLWDCPPGLLYSACPNVHQTWMDVLPYFIPIHADRSSDAHPPVKMRSTPYAPTGLASPYAIGNEWWGMFVAVLFRQAGMEFLWNAE